MVPLRRLPLRKFLLVIMFLDIVAFLVVRHRLDGSPAVVNSQRLGASSPADLASRELSAVETNEYVGSVNISIEDTTYQQGLVVLKHVHWNTTASDEWVSIGIGSGIWLWKTAYFCNQYCKLGREIVVIGLKKGGLSAVGQYAFIRYRGSNECVPLHSSEIAAPVSLASHISNKKSTNNLQLRPYFWTGLLQHASNIPLSITFSARHKCREQLWNTQLLVHHIDEDPLQVTKKVGLCSPKVLQLNTSLLERRKIIDWIEMNKLLGVERITLYTTGWQQQDHYPDMARILNSYIHEGLLEVVEWGSPEGSDLMRSVECIYRNYDKVNRVIVSDLNELVVPRGHTDMHQMIRSLRLTQCIVVRFHVTQWFSDEIESSTNSSTRDSTYCPIEGIPIFLQQTVRYQHPTKDSRKWAVLVEPMCLSNAMHLMTQFFTGRDMYLVPSNVATRHQYGQMALPSSANTLRDTIMNTYQSAIREAVQNRLCPSTA